MGISIETLRPDDRERRHMLGREAFGHTRAFDADQNLPDDCFVAVYDDHELVASTAMIEGGHWFGGKPVDGPGISGVSVAAHRRGTGVAKPMLEEVVRRLSDGGAAISGLLPTTASYYRGAGWELAGDWVTRELPVEAFATTARAEADIHTFEIDELPSFGDSYDSVARHSPGHVVRGDRWWWFRQRHYQLGEGQGYLLRSTVGDASGYLILRAEKSDRRILDLWIEDVGADDIHVLRSLGGLIARFGTVAGMVKANQPSWLLEAITPEGQRWTTTTSFGWMMRIVDIGRACTQRGWPPLSGRVDLTVADPLVQANNGSFRLSFDEGECVVAPSDRPGAQISIQALSSWFTGWRSGSQLEFLGQLQGANAETVNLLDGLTSGAVPLTNEFY